MPRRVLAIAASVAVTLVAAGSAEARSFRFDLKTKREETRGGARAVGTIKLAHGRDYENRRAVIKGRLNDICPADGYGAYLELRLYYPGSDTRYAAKRVTDTRTCGRKAKRFFAKTGAVRNPRKVSLWLYKYDDDTGDVTFEDQAYKEWYPSQFDRDY